MPVSRLSVLSQKLTGGGILEDFLETVERDGLVGGLGGHGGRRYGERGSLGYGWVWMG